MHPVGHHGPRVDASLVSQWESEMASLSNLQREVSKPLAAHHRGHKRMSSGAQKGLSLSASVPSLPIAGAASPAQTPSAPSAANLGVGLLKGAVSAKVKALGALAHARQASNGLLPPVGQQPQPPQSASMGGHSRTASALGSITLALHNQANSAAGVSANGNLNLAAPLLARKPPLPKPNNSTATNPKAKLLSALAPLKHSPSLSPFAEPNENHGSMELDSLSPLPVVVSRERRVSGGHHSFRPATAPQGARGDLSSASSSSPAPPQSQSQMTLASIKQKLLGAQQAAMHSEQAMNQQQQQQQQQGLSAAKHSPALLKKSLNILSASMNGRPLSAQAQSPLRRA
jgi:hypothetical protein